MEKITSPNNSKIKLAASLHLRKNRENQGMFIAEGVRLCEMAAASEWETVFAVVTEEALKTVRVAEIIKQLERKECPIFETTELIYKKAATTETPQGLLIVMKKQSRTLADLTTDNIFLTVLDGVQDAGNAGSTIRTADAVGCSAVVFLDGCVDAFSDKTVRSAMGSVFHLPVIEKITAEEFLKYCLENSIEIYSTALERDAESCFSAKYANKKALVFGNEGNGVSKKLLENTKHLYIPMKGKTESLNVAAAAAVTLYSVYQSQ